MEPYRELAQLRKTVVPAPGTGSFAAKLRACPNHEDGCQFTYRRNRLLKEHILAGKCQHDDEEAKPPAQLAAMKDLGELEWALRHFILQLLLSPLFLRLCVCWRLILALLWSR